MDVKPCFLGGGGGGGGRGAGGGGEDKKVNFNVSAEYFTQRAKRQRKLG